ncbi:MAG TPA: hypothetical protein VFE46_00300 [Pirellulales bacterium]|jgi:tetratricopeptide (TPR) repeat protein|nr:hypothetical protein [Pirellulales bacterium]
MLNSRPFYALALVLGLFISTAFGAGGGSGSSGGGGDSSGGASSGASGGASVPSSGGSWKGAIVMPLNAQIQIQDDNGASVSMYNIGWPARVQRTKGRFLWIQDEGGYSRNQAGGWIYADDAVKLDDAQEYYSNQLQRAETAWLYWMRGISWEAKNEPGIALLDYRNALDVAPQTRIDDIHIRLGRLYAQQQLLGGHGKYEASAKQSAWEKEFNSAKALNPQRPQLYYEWGLALSQACACAQATTHTAQHGGARESKAASQAFSAPEKALLFRKTATGEAIPKGTPAPAGGTEVDLALQQLEKAAEYSPHWWRVPLARAEVLFNQCDEESPLGERAVIDHTDANFFTQMLTHCKRKDGSADNIALANNLPPDMISRGDEPSAEDRRSSGTANAPRIIPVYMHGVLAEAMDDYNRAIRLNPNAIDAYRDRAEILRLVQSLDAAKESATTACKLCNYRQAGSLRTLAQINFDLKQYQPAASYAWRAAELAGGDDEQQRYFQLWNKCCKQCRGDEKTIAAAAAPPLDDVASRGDGSEDDSEASKKPVRIEPPPGFLSRTSSAFPE